MSRIIKETTVYGGPRTSGYATMATLHQNQSVTAVFKELDFLFVEYDGKRCAVAGICSDIHCTGNQ